MQYDVLYQNWVTARKAKNFILADSIRVRFERLHGLTIFAEGDMVIEGITVKRMAASIWEKKYGDAKVGEIMATWDSRVKQLYPDAHPTSDLGYHY